MTKPKENEMLTKEHQAIFNDIVAKEAPFVAATLCWLKLAETSLHKWCEYENLPSTFRCDMQMPAMQMRELVQQLEIATLNSAKTSRNDETWMDGIVGLINRYQGVSDGTSIQEAIESCQDAGNSNPTLVANSKIVVAAKRAGIECNMLFCAWMPEATALVLDMSLISLLQVGDFEYGNESLKCKFTLEARELGTGKHIAFAPNL
jgi:hypothetical protein